MSVTVPEEEEEEEHEQEPVPPHWPKQHAAYSSFVTAREEDGRRQFRDFIMAANYAAEECAKELSLQLLIEDEYAHSFAEAQWQAHEEMNTMRAVAHSHLVDDAFCRAAEARELERLRQEAVAHDAQEEAEFAERELQAEQAAEAEREEMAEQARQATGSLGQVAEAPMCAGAQPSG